MQAVVRAMAPVARGAGRRAASSGASATAVRYHRYGVASEVCAAETVGLPDKLAADEVLVKMIAAPVTDFDISSISGFDSKRSGAVFPATAGIEGVGVVEAVGDKVKDIKQGAHVVPIAPTVGTWATHAVTGSDNLAVVDGPVDGVEHSLEMIAASVVPGTIAVATLEMAEAGEGDVIVQTAAHSAVGQTIAWLAATKGIAMVNIVPDHPQFEDLAQHLNALNPAGLTVSETTARSPAFAKLLSDLPAAKAAIDGQGGSAAIAAASTLGFGGRMISYANASRKPVVLPMDALLTRNITAAGFGVGAWAERVSVDKRRELAASVAQAAGRGDHGMLLERVPFGDWEVALRAAGAPNASRRAVMRFD